jgi:hypothetical protein
MAVRLEPSDRKILIVAGALLLALTGLSLLLTPPAQPGWGFPSSYSTASDGAKAAFLLLEQLGYSVARWEAPLTELPLEAGGTVLILTEPFLPSSAGERVALRRFVSSGGRVLATGILGASLIPEGDAEREKNHGMGWKDYPALIPSPLTREAAVITLAPRAGWRLGHDGHLALYGDDQQAVVVTYRVGRGQVVWWAAPTPLTNAGIQSKNNLRLLLNSVGSPEAIRVLWDEYYHGERGSLWSYLAHTPVPWVLLQLGLLFLAVCATFARRDGPVRPRGGESRLSPLEFVETMGDLYHRAQAAPAAVAIAYQRFRFLVSRQLGVPPRAPLSQLQQALSERLGRSDSELGRILHRSELLAQERGLEDAEALELVQGLHDYARIFGLLPHQPQESHGCQNG